MTTGFVIPAFLAFSFSQTETGGLFNVGSKVIHAEFESVEILNISSCGYSRDPLVFNVSVIHLSSSSVPAEHSPSLSVRR